MNIIGIIPARMASSRFPNKPMADILGMPMIGHCYLRCKMSSILNEVYVATCDEEIFEYITGLGGKAIMTKDTHERATDRTAEALEKIESQSGERVDIVVMLQGDEPMITPDMISEAVQPLLDDPEIKISNLMAEMETIEEHEDPNEVKVVVDNNNFALYFSREPIPSRRKGAKNFPMLKQVCIIPFKRDFLFEYSNMKETPLEIIESVDMMRILENGLKVKMIPTDKQTYAVDNETDLQNVIDRMRTDVLLKEYL